jgi:hypothetical protein
MRIPTREDWGRIDANDLDGQWALKTFLGKSRHEAAVLFERNAYAHAEDIQSMPRRVFNYYVPPLIEHLLSEKAKGDSDGASSFLHRMLWMFQTQPDVVVEMRAEILAAAENVAARQAFYEADESIYGRFHDAVAELKAAS